MNLLKFESHSEKEYKKSEEARFYFGNQSMDYYDKLVIEDNVVLQDHCICDSDSYCPPFCMISYFPSKFLSHWHRIFAANPGGPVWLWEDLVKLDDFSLHFNSEKIHAIYDKLQTRFGYQSHFATKDFLWKALQKKVECKMSNEDFLKELNISVQFEDTCDQILAPRPLSELELWGAINPWLYSCWDEVDCFRYVPHFLTKMLF